MLSLMGIRSYMLTDTPRAAVAHLPDADYLAWLLFAMAQHALIHGYVYSKVVLLHDGRGIRYSLCGDVPAVRSLYSRISQLITLNWDRWAPWVLALDLRAIPKPNSAMFIDIRIYAPRDSVIHEVCQIMYKEYDPAKDFTASDMIDLMCVVNDRRNPP
jgi:hypothetical protein